MFYHKGKDFSYVAHGDDFDFCSGQEDLTWITEQMSSWFEIKVRATLGREFGDDKHVIIRGRHARWAADPLMVLIMRQIRSIGS